MPHSPSLPTASNPSASGTTFYGSSIITAPADLIWTTLLDFQNYTWNTFTPTADFSSPPQVGRAGTISVRITPDNPRSRPTHVQVTLVDSAARRLCSKSTDYPSWALRPERMQEIMELGDGKCEYRSWETIAGHGAWVVALMMGGQLDEANRRCGEDLKRIVKSKIRKNDNQLWSE